MDGSEGRFGHVARSSMRHFLLAVVPPLFFLLVALVAILQSKEGRHVCV